MQWSNMLIGVLEYAFIYQKRPVLLPSFWREFRVPGHLGLPLGIQEILYQEMNLVPRPWNTQKIRSYREKLK